MKLTKYFILYSLSCLLLSCNNALAKNKEELIYNWSSCVLENFFKTDSAIIDTSEQAVQSSFNRCKKQETTLYNYIHHSTEGNAETKNKYALHAIYAGEKIIRKEMQRVIHAVNP